MTQKGSETMRSTKSIRTAKIGSIMMAAALSGIGVMLILFPREDRYRVSGRAEDLAVEAIEMCDLRFWIGVQWHPERMLHDPIQRRLFQVFIDTCSTTR